MPSVHRPNAASSSAAEANLGEAANVTSGAGSAVVVVVVVTRCSLSNFSASQC